MKIDNKDATVYSVKELSHIIKKALGEEKNMDNLDNLINEYMNNKKFSNN